MENQIVVVQTGTSNLASIVSGLSRLGALVVVSKKRKDIAKASCVVLPGVGTFKAAMSSNPDWLHISTFNELYEFSHIEATFEHGYTYIDLTAEFVREFKGRKQRKQEDRAGPDP